MAKTKEQKKKEVDDLKDKISRSNIVVFTSFSNNEGDGLKVNESQELKKKLKKDNSEYVVSKKRLANVALNDSNYSDIVDTNKLDGSLGLAFGYDDPMVVSKTVYDFSKSHQSLKLLGAIMDKDFYSVDRFIQLAQLPSKDVLLGRMIGMIQYPLTGLASVLQGNIRNLVLILSNIKK